MDDLEPHERELMRELPWTSWPQRLQDRFPERRQEARRWVDPMLTPGSPRYREFCGLNRPQPEGYGERLEET